MLRALFVCCAVWLSYGSLAPAGSLDALDSNVTTFRWSHLPDLPDEFGFGGPAAGVHNDALIVAGGANFPEAPPWEGGKKVWHDRIFVLEKDANGEPQTEWQQVGTLPKRIAYGVSVSTKDGMLLIGGEEDGQAIADVYRLTWDAKAKKIGIETLPPLPQPATYLSGGRIGSAVYIVAAGRSEGADRLDEKYFWALDLEKLGAEPKTTWKEDIEPCPGAPRHKAVAAVQSMGSGQENLFLFSGSNPRFLPDGSADLANFEQFTDAYRYDPKGKAWSRIADLPVLTDPRDLPDQEKYADARWPVSAGTGIGAGQSHILVFSGATGRYITLPVGERPLFPNTVLAYHTITDTWVVAGEMPTGVVTTSIVRWGVKGSEEERIILPSGEIKPGVRTPAVQALNLQRDPPPFGKVNYTVLIVYLLGMVAVGGAFALRTKSTDDFFRGGQRVPSWVAGLSIFATMLSSLTFISLPALAYATDWLYYPGQLTIIPIALVVVSLAIPFFRRIDATSAYEYLEKRFNRTVRLIGSALFVMFQIGRIAIVMYLSALALHAITPLTEIECILIMGVLSIIYCTLGGVEAVVWTDAIQTLVLMCGLLVALVVIVMNVDGGVSTVWSTALADGKMELANLDFGWNSYTTSALWVILIGQFFQSLYAYTSDQAIVQRYMTTKDEQGARRAIWTNAWMGVFGSLLFFILGAALYVFYKNYPMELHPGMKNDEIFPIFISYRLPIGVAGLVVAGIFAAAQSTISTSLNSTATSMVTDFCVPFDVCKSDKGYLWLARLFTVLLGVFGTIVAYVFVKSDIANMFQEFMKILGLFGGVLCGLFMLGMLTRRANATGALLGGLLGIVTVWSVKLYTEASFLLYAAVGIIATVVAGYLISLVTPADDKDISGLTIHRGVEPAIES